VVVPALYSRLLLPLAAKAATIVFLQGAPTGLGQNQDFEFARDLAKETGSAFVSAGWNGTSPATGAALDSSLRSEEDFRATIRRAVKSAEDSGSPSLLLSIHSHGAPPVSDDLLNGGVALYPASADWLPKAASHFSAMVGKKNELSYKEMEKIIGEEVPAKLRVKIEMDSCFGGSVHQLAFDAANVCSSSVTDSETTSMQNPDSKYSTFDHAFLTRLRDAPHSATLYEMHSAAMDADRNNGRRALLSSEAYIDSALGEGSFAKGILPKYASENSIGMIAPFLGAEKRFASPDWREAACRSDSLVAEFVGVSELVVTVNQVLERTALGEVPEPLRLAMYGDLKSFESQLAAGLPSISTAGSQERESVKNLLREKRELLQRAERVAQFLRTATPPQKEKYLSLLRCETEPL